MNVRDFLDHEGMISSSKVNDPIRVEGWLVVIDSQLFLLDEELADPYTDSKKIMLSNPLIAYPIVDVVLLKGGGESMLFHKAKILGIPQRNPTLQLKVDELYINNGRNECVTIDLSAENIEKMRKKHGTYIRMSKETPKFDDWMDYAEWCENNPPS